ncbi:MAG: response regulator [Nitrospiria bacterium]
MALFIGLYGVSMIVTARRVCRSVTRSLELAEDLKTEGPLPVFGDSGQVQQVILNILQNAHQAIVGGEEGGVRFTVAFSLDSADRPAAVEAERRDSLPEGLKILVVEDDARFSEWLCLTLEREGASVIMVADGAAALEYFGDGRVDCMLSDLRMPRMDGIALWKWLREH